MSNYYWDGPPQDFPKWETVQDVWRLLDEYQQAKRTYGTDQGVTRWMFDRWDTWAWKWDRPRRS